MFAFFLSGAAVFLALAGLGWIADRYAEREIIRRRLMRGCEE